MITRGMIEEVISPYEVRVRIPTLDRSPKSSISTSKENLNIATICTLPNCYVNLQVGDVVFVAFEDNSYNNVVVLGHLSREVNYDTYADVNFNDLNVIATAHLPSQTTIGDVTEFEIHSLIGTKDNLQGQIDLLKQQVAELEEQLSRLAQSQ